MASKVQVRRGIMALALLAMGALDAQAALPAPAASPAIAAADMGPVFRGAHPQVLGLDGAYSLPMGSGRSLWIFGDTLIGSYAANGDRVITGFPPNTAAVVSDSDWVTGFSRASFVGQGTPGAVIHSSSPQRRIWPLDLVRVEGQSWMYFVEIEPKGKGPLDFEVSGYGVAPARTESLEAFENRGFLWPGTAPSFGTSVLAYEGHLYCFSGGGETKLARMPLGRPDEVTRYTYWAGDGAWASDWKQAVPLPGSGPEMSVRYNPYLASFVMIYTPPFARTVEARFAPKPWGPWSAPVKVIEGQPQGDAAAMFYGAKQHVELDSEGGRQIVVTYNTNAPETLLASRPDLYWPHLVRIRFEKR